jgi:hypothetical protein
MRTFVLDCFRLVNVLVLNLDALELVITPQPFQDHLTARRNYKTLIRRFPGNQRWNTLDHKTRNCITTRIEQIGRRRPTLNTLRPDLVHCRTLVTLRPLVSGRLPYPADREIGIRRCQQWFQCITEKAPHTHVKPAYLVNYA